MCNGHIMCSNYGYLNLSSSVFYVIFCVFVVILYQILRIAPFLTVIIIPQIGAYSEIETSSGFGGKADTETSQ